MCAMFSEQWKHEHVIAAERLFGNQGMHGNARFIASLDPGALDYLKQAPVLTLAMGAKHGTRADRLYLATRLGGPISRGEKLKVVMAAVGLPYPLRKLKPSALAPSCGPILATLRDIDNSTLAQIIPDESGPQIRWFSIIREWNARMRVRGHQIPVRLDWIARQAGLNVVNKGEAPLVVDYLHRHPDAPIDRWSWQRTLTEVELWHDRLAMEDNLKGLPGFLTADTVIDLSNYADHTEIAGFEVFKLATAGMLIAEGTRMRHCVASYIPDVFDGRTSIFSIRKDMRRLATLQIKDGQIVQLAGFANSSVPKYLAEIADQFVGGAAQ